MNLLSRLLGRSSRSTFDIQTVDDYAKLLTEFAFNGGAFGIGGGLQQTQVGTATEKPAPNFVALSQQAYGACGPVFSCMLVRMLVFSSVRFEWQRLRQGKPSDTFANDRQLRILQRPWQNGNTQDLLIRMIQDADLAGNSYWYKDTNLATLGTQSPKAELVRLRPDWVELILEPRIIRGGDLGSGQVGWRKLGYLYTEGGPQPEKKAVALLPDEVCHFMPIPDPLANFRGMSWLTPVLREIQADHAMIRHQRKFFDNAATPNMVVKYTNTNMTPEKFQAWRELLDTGSKGIENAYKTLHLAPGAEPVAVGFNMKDIDFKLIRDGGETRIAAAAGVPPVIAGFSEGLGAATYSNYSQARRRFADGTMHPLWENVAGSLEDLLDPPDDARLWYVAKDVPFLREDQKDAALIAKTEAETINSLITAGYKADSVTQAVIAQDWSMLQHSGLMSVQLLPPGSVKSPKPGGSETVSRDRIVELPDGQFGIVVDTEGNTDEHHDD